MNSDATPASAGCVVIYSRNILGSSASISFDLRQFAPTSDCYAKRVAIISMKTWRLAIKIVGTAVAVLVVGLAPAGLFVAKAAADRLQLSMMESKSNSMGNMGQPGGQPQSMARGGMQDNKMRMQTPGQIQDCQASVWPRSRPAAAQPVVY